MEQNYFQDYLTEDCEFIIFILIKNIIVHTILFQQLREAMDRIKKIFNGGDNKN